MAHGVDRVIKVLQHSGLRQYTEYFYLKKFYDCDLSSDIVMSAVFCK